MKTVQEEIKEKIDEGLKKMSITEKTVFYELRDLRSWHEWKTNQRRKVKLFVRAISKVNANEAEAILFAIFRSNAAFLPLTKTEKKVDDEVLRIDLTKLETSRTCEHCEHWRNKQSIFDFRKNTGICLEAPKENLIGSHDQVKRYLKNGQNEGMACFNGFAENEEEKAEYFITKENFGCIKFEQKSLNN